MRFAAGTLAAVVTLVVATLVIGQVQSLSAEGQGLSGALGDMFNALPTLVIILFVGVIGIGTLVAAFGALTRWAR